jgi:hypothetical protein
MPFDGKGMMMTTAFLENDQLAKYAPSIFAEAPHTSRSDRYRYIPTIKVVDALRNEGFAPVKVQVARVKEDGRKGFEKHLIRFRRTDSLVKPSVGDVFPEVVLVNSHDGTTSYKLSAGLFRLVCSNGLVVGQGASEEITIRHQGNSIVDDVIEGSFRVLDQSKAAIEVAGQWGQIKLSPSEQTALAIGAHHLRFADSDGVVETPIRPEQLLRPRRMADDGADLWTVFNRIQENSIKGGLHGTTYTPTGRRRRVSTREVKGIDGNLNLNRALWKIAEAMAASKQS